MKFCPISYDEISENESYSLRGLHWLSPKLSNLQVLNYSADEQRKEAIARAGKMSIQGIQAKLSAQLNVKEQAFVLVDQGGHYIIKPQSQWYSELPENEALTMTLAESIGLDAPTHGLIYSKDNSFSYFIKRFDRVGHNKKLAMEDFAQLLGKGRDTKYNSSMEQIAAVIDQYCSMPKVEALRLLKLTLFNFLIGNADMHLKNFSLVTRDQKVMLSPAYDLLNTTIAADKQEELALPLNGQKKNLRKKDFLDYFAIKRLNLNSIVVDAMLQDFKKIIPQWKALIDRSFLSENMKEKYRQLLEEDASALKLSNQSVSRFVSN